MSNSDTTISAVRQAVRRFRDERNWRQFHSPKNLSMSIAIEAAELMEHFQWLTTEEATNLARAEEPTRQAIVDELADVLIYCISLADVLDCDIGQIVLDKLAKAGDKYPIDKYYGNFGR